MPSLSRLMFAATLLFLTQAVASAQGGQWKLPNKKASPPKPAVRSEWQHPERACSLLADIPGMQTRGYKNRSSMPKEYFCSSPYKSVSDGWPSENNIAYYVVGDHDTAWELRLVLNVDYKHTAEIAQNVLAVASNLLTKRALGATLSVEVLQTLLSGNTGKWDAGENQILIEREEWPNGRGYLMKFIIR